MFSQSCRFQSLYVRYLSILLHVSSIGHSLSSKFFSPSSSLLSLYSFHFLVICFYMIFLFPHFQFFSIATFFLVFSLSFHSLSYFSSYYSLSSMIQAPTASAALLLKVVGTWCFYHWATGLKVLACLRAELGWDLF